MPDPRSLFRLAALAGFLLLVAVGLWLLDAAWPVVVGVMAAAWVLAAVVEWAAWRVERHGHVAAERQLPTAEASTAPAAAEHAPELLTAPEPEPPLLPPLEEEAALPPPKGESVKEPRSEPPAAPQAQESERKADAPVPLRAKRPERPSLRPVPQPPPPAPPPAAARATAPPSVVDLRRRATTQARHWNLWDLEHLAREELQDDPQRSQELSYLFLHLRQFASADGSLPTEFDPLVRESLGDLLEPRR